MTQRLMVFLAALLFFALSGCNGSNSNDPTEVGTLKVSLTDTASPDYKAVYVSVNQVEVKASANENDNGWLVVDTVNKTINLLDITGGRLEALGTRDVPAREYNQIRLLLTDTPDDKTNINGNDHPHANYVIDLSDNTYELNVPSGLQSGIKLVKKFTIETSGLTELILDFDAMKSVVKAISSDKWLLNPVIHVIETESVAGIGGSVFNASDDSAQQATWMALQTQDATATDTRDAITTHAGTLADLIGAYFLRVPADDYTLVAFKEGFAPECQNVTTVTGETFIRNFALTAATSGTLTVTVRSLSTTDEPVTVSIRMEGDCGGAETIFYEVTSQSFAEDGSYTISLPPGTYTVVAYGDSMTTLSEPKVITEGNDTPMTVRVTTAP